MVPYPALKPAPMVVGCQAVDDVTMDSLKTAALLGFRPPPLYVPADRVVSFPLGAVGHPTAGALGPSAADPLRRYPEPTEAIQAVREPPRMDYVVVCGPIRLRLPATGELT